MRALADLIEAARAEERSATGNATRAWWQRLADAAEAERKELERAQGLAEDFKELARQRKEQLAERDRADAELLRELEHQRGGGTHGRLLAQLERWAAAKGGRWNGLCPAGKHGADWQGQRCDLCAKGGGK